MAASRYGMDMAHAENTISNLKTAKLNRDRTRRAFEREDLEDEAYGNYLTKRNPNEVVEASDTNEDGIVDEKETKNALRRTGKKFGAIEKITNKEERTENRRNVISNRNSRTASANNRRSVLNRATNEAEKRASQRVIASEDRLMKYAETASAVAGEKGATPKEQELVKQRVLNKKKEYDKTFGDYLNEKDINTKLATLDAVGKSAMNAKSATEANNELKKLNQDYTKALKDKNTGVAEILEEVLSDIPSNFTEENFPNQKAEMLAEVTLATDYIESRAGQAKLSKALTPTQELAVKKEDRITSKEARTIVKDWIEDDERIDYANKREVEQRVMKEQEKNKKPTREIYESVVKNLKKGVSSANKAVPSNAAMRNGEPIKSGQPKGKLTKNKKWKSDGTFWVTND